MSRSDERGMTGQRQEGPRVTARLWSAFSMWGRTVQDRPVEGYIKVSRSFIGDSLFCCSRRVSSLFDRSIMEIGETRPRVLVRLKSTPG